MIYLDSMASTPLAPEVRQLMQDLLNEPQLVANPFSNHTLGHYSNQLIQTATNQLSELIQAEEHSIIWTSGATESINLALKGAVNFYRTQGNHIITTATEHLATLNVCAHLAKQGFHITYLQPNRLGHYTMEQWIEACTPDTILISIHHGNNEIGTLNNLEPIAHFCQEQGLLLHVDAAQTLGKIPINLQNIPIDLMSMSAHKCYGPKGVGALYCRQQNKKVQLTPEIVGGKQQRLYRAGTISPLLIAAMGQACARALNKQDKDHQYCKQLSTQLSHSIMQQPNITLNGCPKQRLPHNLNLTIQGIANHQLIQACPNLCFSGQSACYGTYQYPSHVLKAIGLTDQEANQSVRLGVHPFLTQTQLKHATNQLIQAIQQLRNTTSVPA
jgi:cysteine desulfurase